MKASSPLSCVRSLVILVSLQNPGMDWPVECKDTNETSAWSNAEMIQVILYHLQKTMLKTRQGQQLAHRPKRRLWQC